MSGRKPVVSDYEIVEFIDDLDQPFAGTEEVAEYIGFSKSGTRKRLYRLSEEGILGFKKVGNSPAFYLTDQGRALLEGDLVENDLDIVGEDDLEQRDRPNSSE